MNSPKLVFTTPQPATPAIWRRTILAMGAVLATELAVSLLWHATTWTGSNVAHSIVVGFGIAFGARYGSTGRFRGPQLAAPLIIGTLSSAVFFGLLTFRS